MPLRLVALSLSLSLTCYALTAGVLGLLALLLHPIVGSRDGGGILG